MQFLFGKKSNSDVNLALNFFVKFNDVSSDGVDKRRLILIINFTTKVIFIKKLLVE